jgi:hypothetical protein
MIDFEKDQESVIQKTENIHSLADQVERLQQIQEDISKNEEYLKQKKKEIRPHIRRSNTYNVIRDGFILS